MTELFETAPEPTPEPAPAPLPEPAATIARIATMLRTESERFQLIDGTAGPDAEKWGWRQAAEALRNAADKVERGEF
jgi:hypothetical protein